MGFLVVTCLGGIGGEGSIIGNIPAKINNSKKVLHQFIPTCDFESPESFWISFKDKFATPTVLGQKIRCLAENPELSTREAKAIFVEAFRSSEYPQLVYFIRKIVHTLVQKKDTDEHLNATIKQLFQAFGEENVEPLIKKLTQLFTLEKIETIIRSEIDFKDTRDIVAKVGEKERYYFEARRKENRDTLIRTAKLYSISSIDTVVNTLMYVFQLNAFFEEEDDDYNNAQYLAMMRYSALRDNLMLLSTWLGALSVYTGNIPLTIASAAVVIISGALSVYVYLKWIKPFPEHVPPFKNLVSEAKKGNLEPVYGRDTEIDLAIKYLCSGKAVMLLGKTRAGKTKIVEGLAQRIAAGNVPDKIKKCDVLSANTSDLSPGFSGNFRTLKKVQREVVGHEEEALFFLDEIHAAFQGDKKLGQKLKTVIDQGPGCFKYCVAATTIEEWEELVSKDSAFRNRFEIIYVDPTNDDQTHAVLTDVARRDGGDLAIEPEALRRLAYLRNEEPLFADCSQPSTSKNILAKAFSHLRWPKLTEKRNHLQKLKDERDTLKINVYSLTKPASLKKEEETNYQLLLALNQQIIELETTINTAENERKELLRMIHKQNKLKEELALKAIEMLDTMKTKECPEDELKEFMLKYHFYQQALQDLTEKMQAASGQTSVVLTLELINELIEEEKKRLTKDLPKQNPAPKSWFNWLLGG